MTVNRCKKFLAGLLCGSAILLPSAGQAQVNFILDPTQFFTTQLLAGRNNYAFEGFETPGLPPGASTAINDPLNSNFNGPYAPGEINPFTTVQSNLIANGVAPSPRGVAGLLANNLGGPLTTGIYTNIPTTDSLDLIVTGNALGVGFNLRSLGATTATLFNVSVFGTSNQLLGFSPFLLIPGQSSFFGISSFGPTISRINVSDTGAFREGIDNVELWTANSQGDPVPEPITLALGVGALGLVLRRRFKKQ